MKLSNYFLPVLKENPKEAQIVSHRLMLRAGMIQQSSAGIYSWLPLGLKVLSKIEQIVREEQDNAGALEIKMPTIQPAEIWQESGRYDDYGLEMLRVKDRHERDMLYGPTNEEQVTDICRSHVKSYRALPLNLYHIQWKFRDEVRPRFGVMRGREFLMKDAYSFDLTPEDARVAYNKMFVSYLKTFARMELTAIPMEADTGPIGGDMSHEFIILADTGESGVFFHKDWLKTDLITNIDYSADLEPVIHKFTELYARTDEKHEPDNCPIKPEDLVEKRGIEVGHIFYFGTKYSKAMAASVSGTDGKPVDLHMGSYGIGVSRLVGGIIEASHDEKGIIWPEAVAPFKIAIVNLKPGNVATDELSETLYQAGLSNGHDCLYDDSKDSAGAKLATMDLIGIPWQIVVGPRGLERNSVELKHRKSGSVAEITPEMAHDFMSGQVRLSMPEADISEKDIPDAN
ncbi:MAG: Proline--tRNA ligase [SAR116 cluster bacterium]|jgi:prolyl-tRNA synthetase|nr:MAG: Proline--tRNA ligase [SAR116 cluster bacterium]